MTTYKCPVCGKQYTDLSKLAECVKADDVAIKRVKAEEARAQTALKEKYIKAIKDSRKNVETTYKTLKTQIAAYNQVVAEARQKAGIVASVASSNLGFAETQMHSVPEIYDWLDKSTVKDADDLASVILNTLGI